MSFSLHHLERKTGNFYEEEQFLTTRHCWPPAVCDCSCALSFVWTLLGNWPLHELGHSCEFHHQEHHISLVCCNNKLSWALCVHLACYSLKHHSPEVRRSVQHHYPQTGQLSSATSKFDHVKKNHGIGDSTGTSCGPSTFIHAVGKMSLP